MTDRLNEITRTTYDNANRAVSVEYLSDTTSQSASYDQYGDKVAITNNDVTYSYTYDNRHLLTSKTDSRNGKTLNWAYDAAGNVINKTDYQGSTTTFTYDDSNRLVAMRNPAYLQASYHYDGAGRLLSRILSNGASTLYNYDKDGYLTKMTQRSANNTVIDERTYGHDDVGNITQVVITGGETISHSYDPAYRLLTADSTNNANDQSWTYDDVGNRQTMTRNGITTYYNTSTGNRLDDIRSGSPTGVIINSYDYDDNGSRIAKRDSGGAIIESYEYDQRRLISQIITGGNTSSFKYDPNAYRINKTTPTITNNYLLEGEHLEATYDATNNLKASYLRGVIVDEIINGFEKDGSGKLINRSFHHDQVNSVVVVTDHTGIAAQTNQYGVFGESLSTTGADTNQLKYTGRESDGGGLYYYRARYYDSVVGRFLSEDPIGFKGGINHYAYVGNNPLNNNDPSGNAAIQIAGGITGFLVGAGSEFFTNDNWTVGSVLTSGAIGGVVGVASTFGAGPSTAAFFAGGSSAAGNAVQQGLNNGFDNINFTEVAVNGTVGALTGGTASSIANRLIPNRGLPSLPISVRNIPEGQTPRIFTVEGSEFFDSPVRNAIGFGIGSTIGAGTQFTNTSNLITNFLDPNFASSSSGASGGFVIYPNKINNNISSSVYQK